MMCQSAYKIINPDKKFVLKYTTVSGVNGFDGSVKKAEPPVRKSID
jgi:thioredoxin reductase (NADPH)